MRGGTENVVGIVALGKACELSRAALDHESAKIASLRDQFESAVRETIEGVSINGAQRVPNISNMMFDGVDGEAVLINLDMQGVAVSTGSACSSGTIEASPVIKALGFDDRSARGAVRFSFGRMNTEEEVRRVAEMLPAIVERIRSLS